VEPSLRVAVESLLCSAVLRGGVGQTPTAAWSAPRAEDILRVWNLPGLPGLQRMKAMAKHRSHSIEFKRRLPGVLALHALANWRLSGGPRWRKRQRRSVPVWCEGQASATKADRDNGTNCPRPGRKAAVSRFVRREFMFCKIWYSISRTLVRSNLYTRQRQ
jgi:hypothetical protein